MKIRRNLLFATALALVTGAAMPVHAQQNAPPQNAPESATVPTNPGFNPDTGQINDGGGDQAPSWSTETIRIPSPEEARAAFLAPVSTQPSLGSEQVNSIPNAEAPQHADGGKQQESKNVIGGPQGSGANSNNPQWGQEAITGQGSGSTSTSGSGNPQNADQQQSQQQPPQQSQQQPPQQSQQQPPPQQPPRQAANGEPPPSGPIGAVGQTMPAKFSKRNDILDRLPIMAFPLGLSDEERKKIYEAVMADKEPAAAGAEALTPAAELSTDQALNGMHPLPDSVKDIARVQSYKYVKSKDKVLLVEPSTRVVIDQITS